MRIIADEHISPKIVRADSELALSNPCSLEAVRGSVYQGRPDEDWVAAFARDQGAAIISADRRMLRRPTMIQKITQTGLRAIFLPQDWAESKRYYQAAHILYWWPKIESIISSAPSGTAWIVPKKMGGGELQQYEEKPSSTQHRHPSAG